MFTLYYVEASGVEASKTFLDHFQAAEEAQEKLLDGEWLATKIEDAAGRVIWTLTAEELEQDNFDEEPMYPDDMSDDAWVLASAGMGTDEDYGYYGDDEMY